MRPRLISACIIATLGLVVPAAIPVAAQAATIEIDIDSMPRGADMAVAWIDEDTDALHNGGETIQLVSEHAFQFRSTDRGFLVQGEGNRLVHYVAGAEPRDVTGARVWRVRTGTYAGRQVAAVTYADGVAWLRVSRIADSSLILRTRLGVNGSLLGFHNARVWVNQGYIDIRNGRYVRVARLDFDRSPVPDPKLNAVALGIDDQLGLTVSPLLGSAFTPWRRPDVGVLAWSPDGKYVLTHAASDFADRLRFSEIRLRNARTGSLVQTFEGLFYAGRVRWEDAEHFLAAMGGDGEGSLDEAPLAWARLGVDGSAERASEFDGYIFQGPDIEPLWPR